MISCRAAIAFACAVSLATPALAGAQGGFQLVGFGGLTDGALGIRIDGDRKEEFYGAELLTNAHGTFHWTIGVAHARFTEANSCCGPTPTLSYHYHSFLPAVGAAYDIPIKPLRVRLSGSAGPIVLRQSHSGTPPPGVRTGDPSWQWQLLYTSIGGSVHYEVSDEFGILAGVRMYNGHSLLGGTSEGQIAPHLGVSWSWPRRLARLASRDSLATPTQSDSMRRSDLRIARSLSRLRPNMPVRLQTRSFLVEGVYATMRPDSIVVLRALGQDTVALTDITSAWKTERRLLRSTLRGAAWGGAIAAIYGAVAAASVDEDCYEYCISPTLAAVVLAVPGAAAGAIVGHVVGWLHRPWRRIYP